MWQNFSKKFVERKAWMAIVLPAWVFAIFVLAQVIMYLVTVGLQAIGAPLADVNTSVLSASYNAITYALMVVMVIGLPWLIKKYKTSREDIGLTKLPSWLDVLLAPAGLVVYIILSALFIVIATYLLPFVDFDQTQDVGFKALTHGYEYALAFLTLVVIAPVAEEILFRGYLMGKLRKHIPLWLTILLVSLLFAIVHGAWNVGIDVFALSIVLCLVRVVSGSLWPSIMIHMMKNGIAFYFLFINPTALSTLGG
jgi:membrane protease YdiL (CAAX protease family)